MRISRSKIAGLGLLMFGFQAAGALHASEWTSWRGASGQGVSDETNLVDHWSPDGENLLWKAEFIGRSTPVVVDGRVCAGGRVGEGADRQERIACFDAETGRKLWEHRFNVYNTTVPFNRVGWASPVADPETGYVYVHGVAGQLNCYDRDGGLVWSRFLTEELGHLSGYGGRTQTPLIEGQQLILSFVSSGWGSRAAPRHRYFSFDKRTGDILWVSTPGGMPYDMNTQSVPVVADIGGRRLLISGNADGWIYALRAADGEKVWSFQLSRRGLNSSVLISGNRVFAGHSEENLDEATMGRVVAIDATGTGDVTATHELWRLNELSAGFPSPAYADGKLYVVDNSANLHRIDAAKGTVEWTHSLGTVGKGSPVLADGKLYVTEVNGRFHILKPTASGVQTLDEDELRVADGRYAEIYGSPAVAGGRIYFTTEGGIYCLGDKNRPREPSVASLRVMPDEVLARPGKRVRFEARGFDARGLPAGVGRVSWTLEGLKGSIEADGVFTPAQDAPMQAGTVRARAGDATAAAAVRVIADPPWSESFDAYEVGSVPAHWIGAPGKFVVQEKDGNRVLAKLYRPKGLLRNALYMGPSTLSNYTIEADLMGNRMKRRRADIGLIASGYTLDLLGNAQRLQVRSWPSEERMAQAVDFAWEEGVWYRMKLRVDTNEDKATIRGKVWPRDQDEPADWTVVVEDPLPIAGGSPGLIGYSPADIYYDNIKVTVNR